MYDYFIKKKIPKFIFFSTIKSAADKVEGDFLTEEIIPSPVGPYGESKIAAENYILANTASENQSVYIFRPCMIHGAGNKGNLNLLYNIINKDIPWPLGAFENQRSFVSIDNLKFSVTAFLENNVKSGIYHIADDESLSTNELIKTMCEAMGTKAKIWKINRRVINIIAKIGTIFHLPLNNERLEKLTENYVVSNKKLKTALGVDKMPVTAREGIIRTICSFKN